MKPQWLNRSLIVGPYLTLCTREEQFREILQHLGVKKHVEYHGSDNAEGTAHYLTNEDGKLCCVVTFSGFEGRDGVEVAGLLIHEAVHIFERFCQDIGEVQPSSEFKAYSIQCIAQELMAEFARQTIR